MQQVLNQVGQIAQRLFAVIWQVLEFVWQWSFGQVVKMFQLSFNTLPLWKQVLFVIVVGALAYFIYAVARDLLAAMQTVMKAIIGLVSALVTMLPQNPVSRANCLWRCLADHQCQSELGPDRLPMISNTLALGRTAALSIIGRTIGRGQQIEGSHLQIHSPCSN